MVQTFRSSAQPRPDLDQLLGASAQRSPDMEAVWTWLVDQDRDQPNWLSLPPIEARALHDGLSRRWNVTLPDVQAVEQRVIPGQPAVPCQLITPKNPEAGCILFLHGGGWAFGNLDTHQRFMRLLAIATHRRVLAVDYRLAPEHPFPAPFDDCVAASRWLADEGAEEFGDGPLVVAGDSAGANLAMAVLLDAIGKAQSKPDLALLFYGAFSNDLDSPSFLRFAEGFGLTRAAMQRFWDFFEPDRAARVDPRLCAVHADTGMLQQLPPLFLNAAGLDTLLCDTLTFSERLREAGVDYELAIHEGVHHGFMQMSLRLPEAQVAIDHAAAFLFRHVRGQQIGRSQGLHQRALP